MRRLRLGLIALAIAVAAGVIVAVVYARGLAIVALAADMHGPLRAFAERQRQPVRESTLLIPWRQGTLAGRRYDPERPTGRAILLTPGVHASGIDEPRLVKFARDLASLGHPVVTAGLTDLEHYRITPRTTDMIEDAAAWLSDQSGGSNPIGMMGISFAGGLSIVAAGRPRLAGRVQFVLSLGGHGDLPRTLHYLATGVQPDGSTRPPHDYGVAIILLGVAERLVPADQVQPLRDAILSFLEASRLDAVDKARSQREFEHARALAAALAEPSRTLMDYVNNRDVARLGPMLLPHLGALGGEPALSPLRSPPPPCRVYLLHGADDNVVPAIESTLVAADLAHRGTPVRLLLTPLVTHASVDRAAMLTSGWALVRFWNEVMGE